MRAGLTEAVLNTRPFDRGFESDHVSSFVRALPPDLSQNCIAPKLVNHVSSWHSKGVANDSLRKKIFLHTNGYGISLEALGPFFKSLGRAIRG